MDPHLGIVTVHDCGRWLPEGDDGGGELAFIAMELLRGESVTARLDRIGKMRAEEAAEVARRRVGARGRAPRRGALHRDLKPDNVFLVHDAEVPSGERAKVLDFGIAKLGSVGTSTKVSSMGTPLYMSPEQCRSVGDGRRAHRHLLARLRRCSSWRAGARRSARFRGAGAAPARGRAAGGTSRRDAEALDALIARLLKKDPDDRPASMSEGAERARGATRGARGPAAPEIVEGWAVRARGTT